MDISEILSSLSQEDMEQLKNAANAIMGSAASEKSMNGDKKESGVPFNASMLGNLGKLSSALSHDDERTALIRALKPMLSEPRQQKADEAIKILKLLQLLPLLRDSGLLKGLL